MDRAEKLNTIAVVLCGADDSTTDCPYRSMDRCRYFGQCRLTEKTDEQLDYILSPIDECIYLEACAGSGKTEVLGMKAAYEICKWNSYNTGIAVLTFTNEATATIADRVSCFFHRPIASNHFIGTFSSFIHGHIAQRFGYKFLRSQAEVKDKSFQIVESGIDQYSNQWLQNYALNFPISKRITLYANQINYRVGDREWFLGQGEQAYSLREQYEAKETQQLISELRKKKQNPRLFEYSYLCKKALECKQKFWRAGFATFEDMNLIARKCLMDHGISAHLSKKFPLIMVDECQDLSKNELEILSLLIEAGSKVHYIGDLHQSIYSFKDSIPQHFNDHAQKHRLHVMQLSDNFRSTQKIVDVSCVLGNIDTPLTGVAQSRFNGQDCYYFEYNDEVDAVLQFQKLLEEKGIDIQKSAVLVRTQLTKAKLNKSFSKNYRTHAIINSVQLWRHGDPDNKIAALQLIGWQLQQWLGFQGRSNNYYYCDQLCPDAVSWRLMLRDILNDFSMDSSIGDYDGVSYSQWYSKNKKHVVEIINSHTLPTLGKSLDTTASFIRAPRGTAALKVAIITFEEKEKSRVETIHAVKGVAFDAVLLLSAPDARGKTGYWENWLKPEDEASRIGYVACTRPRFLLCWGVHSLTDSQREIIERIGFAKYNNQQ